MARLMDIVTENGGSFETLDFRAGVRRDDISFVRLAATAPSVEQLDRIVALLVESGAQPEDLGSHPPHLVEVENDGVAPEDFYGTTIFPTDVLVDGQWVRAIGQRMDGVLVVGHDTSGKPTVRVTLIRDLKRGERVVVGAEGLRVHTRTDEKRADEDFQFMSSAVSSERRVEIAVESIAWEMLQLKRRGARIVLVAGPVAVHTGGVEYLCELVRRGYVHALLAGNAVAVHDIERTFFGTSLGVDLQRGVPVHGGHRHHLMAINRIRRAGSIAEAVRQGVLTSGFMYELVSHDVPFVLAGSIRDDGPLPDTEMDLVVAQREYARLLEGAGMVLMLASMLHSIGVGNMTPAGVKLVCVDINTSTATKLADRGSMEAVPVVTDVGLFLNLLVRKLSELED
jgi:lysine-ketoglutarate reductase/saccharopine dehydrogenase-like protein (TIGR00300 family)